MIPLLETHLTKAVFTAARNAFLEDKKKKELQKELRKVNNNMNQNLLGAHIENLFYQAFGMEDKVELEIMINHACGVSEADGVQKKIKVSF